MIHPQGQAGQYPMSQAPISRTMQLLQARGSLVTRPTHYEQLLLEPIIDDTTHNTTPYGSYSKWEDDHCGARRFYVVGIHRFLSATGINQLGLFNYRKEAHDRVKQKTTWMSMPDPKGYWEELGKPQIMHACKKEPMPFAKCAMVLMACEVALESIIADPNNGLHIPNGITFAEQIYGYMAILPAVWNIDDFGTKYLDAVTRQYGDPVGPIRNALGLRNHEVIVELATGWTVTRDTANRIRDYANAQYRTGIPLGPVRAQPGTHLGIKNASALEGIEVE